MEWIGPLVGGGGIFAGLGALLTYLATRKKTVVDDATQRFQDNLALNQYIDERVKAATDKLVVRVEALEAREDNTKKIVRRFFQRLVFWDLHGRNGPMPMPSPTDMRDLELEDLQTTTTEEN
jgi:hypothetical protein